ncbi:PDR/VanB family oxidoreductase [Comamonas sp. 26]|uniref:PDR/VanB family oxidoreductase n=1 Tax=Comamonas sp. 26 TaxID=2035201 RepID=UPI000C1979CC|nr:PDR/VanB family oxidoreductase [Comamonas sp. 26]PIG09018.1 ferredoxin-NADP reductase [Comamonas sp. 26]
MSNLLATQIVNIRWEAPDICSLTLRPLDHVLKATSIQAGAHIDLHLGKGIVRSYSLINPGDTQSYRIAVKLEPASRGGSRHVHQQLHIGQSLEISQPRNHFSLDESAAHSVLVAGGIGITPIFAMLQRLQQLGKTVHLIYCARRRADAAFLNEIETLMASHADGMSVQYCFADEGMAIPDLQALLAGHTANTHFYCCGPAPMLDAFEQACAALGHAHLHLERFSPPEQAAPAASGSYTAMLKKSGLTLKVETGQSLLDAILDAGVTADFSCREGICGSCETKVLCGEVEHRDFVLSKEEKAANRTMMLCVSACKSEYLELDI